MRRPAMMLLLLGMFLGCYRVNLSADENKPQTLFYLDDSRLITLRFQVTVNEKPFAWDELLDDCFQKLDKDQDGKLSAQELEKLNDRRLQQGLLWGGQASKSRPIPAGVTRKEFGESIEGLGIQPFAVNVESSQNSQRRVVTSFGRPSDANQAAKLLFSRLDQDGDGKLSREEQEHAVATLAKSDLDQDETISSAELVPVNYPRYFVSDRRMGQAQQDQTRFLSLGNQNSIRQVAGKLTAKYDKDPKDNALTRVELGLSEKLFAGHDMDGNGQWDFEEIQQYLRSPSPDVTITVRLGKLNEGRERIEFQHDEKLNSEVKNAIGSLNLGSVQMEISTASFDRSLSLEAYLKSQFRAADRDNNGYIDKEESRRLGLLSILFEVLDADHDEKLFIDEAVEGILPMARLLSQQVRLTVTDRGRDLFRILDSNGDGRLSQREFRAMPDRAALWDKDKDGRIAETEIPQQYRLVTVQGDLNRLNGFSGFGVVSSPDMTRRRTAGTASGPLWFQRMDRNRDGDVSPREFLGSAEVFQKLDQNGDGLISPDEADLSSNSTSRD